MKKVRRRVLSLPLPLLGALLGTLVVLLLALPAAAKDAPEKDAGAAPEVTMADAERVVQRNLQVFMAGKQAGGVSMRLGRMKDGSVLMEYRFVLNIVRANGGEPETFRIETNSVEFVDAQGKTRWVRSREEEAGAVTHIHSRYTDTHVEVRFDGPGAKFEKTLELPKNHSTDYLAFRTLLPKFEKGEKAHLSYVSLEAEDQTFEPHETTILGRASVAHGGRKVEGYKVRAVSPSGPAELIVDADFMPMHLKMLGIIEAKWTDGSPFEFSADGFEISSFIPAEGIAPMEPPLERLEVTMTFEKPLQGDKPLVPDNRYQKVVKDGDTLRFTLLSTRVPADAKPLARPVASDDAEVKRFLAPTPLSQSEHPSIVAKAKEIVGADEDALNATRRIVLWVYENVAKRGGKRGNATAVEVLKDCVGDCSEHAALTVALCRAAGIPARNASGLVYLSTRDGRALAGYHAWGEVWLGRWVAVDATIPEVGTSARYILFEIDEPGMTEGNDAPLRAMAASPRLRIDAYTPLGGVRTKVEIKKQEKPKR